MNTSEKIILKKLVAHSKGEPLLNFLLEEEKKQIEQLKTPFFDERLNKLSHKSLIDFVHYSWLASILRNYNDIEKHYFFNLFSPTTSQKLQAMLKLSVTPSTISPIANKFLLNKITATLTASKEDLLPINFLPESSLNFLLLKPKEELMEIIDYLGLFDLASSLKHIVDRTTIDKINSFLPVNHKKFLMRNIQEPFLLPPLDLKTWDGNMLSLQNIVHKRGLLRLKIAIAYQDKSYIWYLAHILDTGRGSILLKQEEKQEENTICQHMIKNIEDITTFLNERRKA
jgi:hypothetical protein